MHSTQTPVGHYRVVTYGTLKPGERNHRVLAGARHLGADRLHSVTLYDLGPYPAATLEASDGVDVEVYAVSLKRLKDLDTLEDHRPHAPEAGLYHRRVIDTRFGPAWLYLYNGPVRTATRIGCGGWSGR